MNEIKTTGRLPDFLIIGAPRCGTSSLFINLLQHPQVTGPYLEGADPEAPYKETVFFSRPERYARWGIDRYKDLFSQATEDSLCFETSAAYLFNPQVPQRVFEHLPDGKFIVLLRNPVDRAVSCLTRLTRRRRREGVRIWKPIHLGNHDAQHRKVFLLYPEALRRWFSYYPRDRFLIIKSEDFFEDEKKIIAQCFKWLGIEPIDIGEPLFFDIINAERKWRPYSDRKRGEVLDEEKAYLREFFKPHNQELYELLGRDFGWE